MPKVYSFKIYDSEHHVYNTASFKATLELIEQEQGIPLPDTEEIVEQYLVKDSRGYILVEQ